jgi:hypothetical protein
VHLARQSEMDLTPLCPICNVQCNTITKQIMAAATKVIIATLEIVKRS